MARLLACNTCQSHLKSYSLLPLSRLNVLPLSLPHQVVTVSKTYTPAISDDHYLKSISFVAGSTITTSPLFQYDGGIRYYCAPVHSGRYKGYGQKLGVRHPDQVPNHDSKATAQVKELIEERKRLADLMESGIKTLLSGDSSLLLDHKVLCLQVILSVPHGKFQDKVREIERDTPCTEPPQHKFEVEVATLLHYAASWIQGCSMVIGELNNLHKRVLSSNLEAIGIKNDSRSTTAYTEVMLYVLSNFEIEEDKGICNSNQLKFFLKNLIKEKNIRRIHITRSNVTLKEDYPENYSHLSIGTS